MAKKKTASGGMNRTERVAGTIFFLVYLLVMPLLATRIFDLLEVVLDTTINDSLRNELYYYTLFAVTVLLFHSYLAHTSSRFLDNLNRAFDDAAGPSRFLRRERANIPRVQRAF